MPVEPEPFHPPNAWTPGQAPVVAPARRLSVLVMERHRDAGRHRDVLVGADLAEPSQRARDPAPEVAAGVGTEEALASRRPGRLDPVRDQAEHLAVPAQLDEPGGPGNEPDWSAVFKEAGLEVARFTPAESRWVPPVFADSRAAWEGSLPDRTEVPIRVEAVNMAKGGVDAGAFGYYATLLHDAGGLADVTIAAA